MSGEPIPDTAPEALALPPADATSEEQAQYLIDNGIMIQISDGFGGRFVLPEAVDNVGTPTFPPGTNVPAPTLSSINPTTATVASLINLHCTGRFTTRCAIVFNGVVMPTTYVNDTLLVCTIEGGTQTAGAKNVVVVDSGVASAPQTFTYT